MVLLSIPVKFRWTVPLFRNNLAKGMNIRQSAAASRFCEFKHYELGQANSAPLAHFRTNRTADEEGGGG
jgi:hypothetical protein